MMRTPTMLAVALAVLVAGVSISAEDGAISLDDVKKADASDDPISELVKLHEHAEAGLSISKPVLVKLHEALRRRWIEKGGYSEAAPHAQALVRIRGTIEDRIIYPEVLLGAIEERLGRGPAISANISPLLADLLAATRAFKPQAGGELSEAQRARVVYVRGRALFLRGRLDDAVAWLDAADLPSLPKPHHARVFDLLARSHYQQGRFEAAAKAFTRGGNREGAAAAWSAAKNPGETAGAYTALLAERPNDAALAQSAIRAVRFAGATEDFLRRLDALPDTARSTPVLLELRGRMLDGAERTTEALALWRALYEKEPNRPGIRAVLARALLSGPQGNDEAVLDEVLELLEAALKADPNDEMAALLMGDRARRDYWALWRDNPSRQRYRRCVRAQKAIVAARPDDATAWANLGNILRVGGRADEALKAYERARDENPYDPAILSDAGLTMAALGRSDDALAAFLESVRLDPGHLAGRQNAARTLWREGRDAEAASQLAAGARTSRARGRTGMTYRALMDRTWRTRRDARLR